MKFLLTISVGEKSRVPLGIEGFIKQFLRFNLPQKGRNEMRKITLYC